MRSYIPWCGCKRWCRWVLLTAPFVVGLWPQEVCAQWRTFTTPDGLVDNYVHSVYQSSDGAMWFGQRRRSVGRRGESAVQKVRFRPRATDR